MERLTTSEYTQQASSFSPDGEALAFTESHPGIGFDVMLLHMRDRKVTPFLNSRFNETYPEFSPDGRWIAYVSDESGRNEVYIQPFPGPGGKFPIFNGGGTEPLWSKNGRQLYFRRQNQVWSVDVQTGSTFAASKARLLFEQSGFRSGGIRNWDIAPDGKRFLMVAIPQGKSIPITEMIMVQNWLEEIRRLAPTGRK